MVPLTVEKTAALDPGIRRLVTLLRANGFNTTDSGDGSKTTTMGCAPDGPMVATVTRGTALVTDAHAVHDLLERHTKPATLTRKDVSIEGSYCTVDNMALVVVIGVSDADLL